MRAVPAGRAVVVAAGLVALVSAARAGESPAGPDGAMLERPLFSPTRRPPPPALAPLAPPAPGLAPPPTAPDVALSGVITGSGGSGVALLRGPLDPVPARVRLGGQVDGWTVSEIRPRAVVLRRDGRSVTVDLRAPSP